MRPVTVQRQMQACGLLLALLIAPAWAQTAAEAAARAQIEQRRADERQLQQREALQRGAEVRGTPDAPPPEPRWPAQETPCFPIRRVVLRGDATAAFGWVTDALAQGPDAAIGRCLGAEGVSIAAARAQRQLTARGFTTSRILLEPQDLSAGTLVLSLLPGRIGAIRFADGTSPRATLLNAVPLRVGDIFNLRDIEQALENLRRVPTVEADIQIVPGQGLSESELIIRWSQALPLRLNLSLDDSGSKATGRYQASATLSVDHWWTLNDLFYITQGRDLGGGEPGARGTRNGNLHYSLPLGYWGLGFNASRYSYFQSVAGLNQDYRYSGHGGQQDITLSRLVQRDESSKTTLKLKAFARQSRNFIDDTEVEVQRRATGGWEFGAEHRRQFGRAQLDLSAAFKRGTGAFGSLTAPEERYGEGTSRFQVLSLDAAWSMPFELWGQRLHFSSQWRGQRERTPLAPQERFAIGGRYSVRGFDGESSLIGERGWLWRNELGWLLGDSGQQLYAGVDQGRVGGPSAVWLVGQRLAGAVLGLRGGWGGWGSLSSLSYDVFIGVPLHKPDGLRTAKAAAGFQLSAGF